MRVAFFGGSFDPPHVGHVLAVSYALATLPVDEALVVPVYSHPFDKPLTPFSHRVAMARLAFGNLAHTTISTIEATLGEPSLTIRTLEHLVSEHPDWTIDLVVGADVLRDSSKWVGWDRIEEYARIVVLGRHGVEHPNAPEPILPDVSSTRIRSLLRRSPRDSESAEVLGRLVPRAVLAYVDEHGLYR